MLWHGCMIPLIAYIAVINALTFFIYWQDKQRSRQGQWRIPEGTLLLLALIGGSPAAYMAQRRFRHKTSKSSFRWRFRAVVLLQCLAILYVSVYGIDSIRIF